MKEYTNMKVTTFKERFSDICDEKPGNTISIADALHVSKQTVSAWRNGTRSPKELTIIAIANHFDVSVEWLMGFDVPKYKPNEPEPEPEYNQPQTPEARLLAKGIDKMPEQQRQAILSMMTSLYPGLFEKGN